MNTEEQFVVYLSLIIVQMSMLRVVLCCVVLCEYKTRHVQSGEESVKE